MACVFFMALLLTCERMSLIKSCPPELVVTNKKKGMIFMRRGDPRGYWITKKIEKK